MKDINVYYIKIVLVLFYDYLMDGWMDVAEDMTAAVMVMCHDGGTI